MLNTLAIGKKEDRYIYLEKPFLFDLSPYNLLFEIRNDKFYTRIYKQYNENHIIYYDVFNPSEFGIEFLKNQLKERNNMDINALKKVMAEKSNKKGIVSDTNQITVQKIANVSELKEEIKFNTSNILKLKDFFENSIDNFSSLINNQSNLILSFEGRLSELESLIKSLISSITGTETTETKNPIKQTLDNNSTSTIDNNIINETNLDYNGYLKFFPNFLTGKNYKLMGEIEKKKYFDLWVSQIDFSSPEQIIKTGAIIAGKIRAENTFNGAKIYLFAVPQQKEALKGLIDYYTSLGKKPINKLNKSIDKTTNKKKKKGNNKTDLSEHEIHSIYQDKDISTMHDMVIQYGFSVDVLNTITESIKAEYEDITENDLDIIEDYLLLYSESLS